MKKERSPLRSVTMFCFFACFFFVFSVPARGAVAPSEWTWDVLVVPPDDGWEGETGISVRNTLLWHRDEISESGEGILGHDIEFTFLPPLSEETAAGAVLPLTSRTIAVFSFASYPVDRGLVSLLAGKGIPLMLACGENVFFYDRGKLLPFVFALDLFRDYRCRAFADYAPRAIAPEARLGIIGTRFTLFEERDAKICYDLMSDAGFLPLPFWADASARSTFDLVIQEVKGYSQGVLISYVGGMATRELWRGFMGMRSPWRLWYGGAPNGSFLSYGGMLFADQNLPLDARGGFEQLRRSLWASRTVAVTDRVAAGRANALALWLTGALSGLNEGEFDRGAFLSRLARVRNIPFGNQVLDIDADTHRPDRRRVFILETRDRAFSVVTSMDVKGLGYYDY